MSLWVVRVLCFGEMLESFGIAQPGILSRQVYSVVADLPREKSYYEAWLSGA